MVETMTQDTKDKIAELERQKIELNDQLETLGYSGNLVRMYQIEEDIFEIIDLQLASLHDNLSKIGLKIRVSVAAKRLLGKRGYKPKYGARPLKREIQVSIEDHLSEVLLKRNFQIGTLIKIDATRGQFKFSYIEKKTTVKKA